MFVYREGHSQDSRNARRTDVSFPRTHRSGQPCSYPAQQQRSWVLQRLPALAFGSFGRLAMPSWMTENQYFWELTRAGEWDKAREIYRWFTPLLHLDVSTKFVQYIKLAVQECGLGKEWVRAPRLPLTGAERKRVLKVIHDGISSRPKIPKRGARRA